MPTVRFQGQPSTRVSRHNDPDGVAADAAASAELKRQLDVKDAENKDARRRRNTARSPRCVRHTSRTNLSHVADLSKSAEVRWALMCCAIKCAEVRCLCGLQQNCRSEDRGKIPPLQNTVFWVSESYLPHLPYL